MYRYRENGPRLGRVESPLFTLEAPSQLFHEVARGVRQAPLHMPLQPVTRYFAGRTPDVPRQLVRPVGSEPGIAPPTPQWFYTDGGDPGRSSTPIPATVLERRSASTKREVKETAGSLQSTRPYEDSQPRPRRISLSPSQLRVVSPNPRDPSPLPCCSSNAAPAWQVPSQVPQPVPLCSASQEAQLLPRERVRLQCATLADPDKPNRESSSRLPTAVTEAQALEPKHPMTEDMGEMLETLRKRTLTFAEEYSRWNQEVERRQQEAKELASMLQRLSEHLASSPRPSRPSPLEKGSRPTKPGNPAAAIREAIGLITPERSEVKDLKTEMIGRELDSLDAEGAEAADMKLVEVSARSAQPVETVNLSEMPEAQTVPPSDSNSHMGSGSSAVIDPEVSEKIPEADLPDEPEEGELFATVRSALSLVVGDSTVDGLNDQSHALPAWELQGPRADGNSTNLVGSTLTHGLEPLSSESAWVNNEAEELELMRPHGRGSGSALFDYLEDLAALVPKPQTFGSINWALCFYVECVVSLISCLVQPNLT